MSFNDKFLNEFWNDCDYSKEEYMSEFPTDEIIAKVEENLNME